MEGSGWGSGLKQTSGRSIDGSRHGLFYDSGHGSSHGFDARLEARFDARFEARFEARIILRLDAFFAEFWRFKRGLWMNLRKNGWIEVAGHCS